MRKTGGFPRVAFPSPHGSRRWEVEMNVRAWAVLALVAALTGCGGPTARVSGRVTCKGKAVKGSILFSPKTENAIAPGPAVAAPLKEDGSFELQLKSLGIHRVVVSPSDVVYPAQPGKDYPCELKPLEREVKAGANQIEIELSPRNP